MTVLSDRTIRELCRYADMVRLPGCSGVESLSVLAVQPCSVDVHLADLGWTGGQRITSDGWEEVTMVEHGFLLGSTTEIFKMPENVVGLVVGKSSIARRGLQVECAGLLDPGFEGQVVLELSNLLAGPSYPLTRDMAIAQVTFMWLDQPVERPYGDPGLGSHYQGQRGITPSHLRMPS